MLKGITRAGKYLTALSLALAALATPATAAVWYPASGSVSGSSIFFSLYSPTSPFQIGCNTTFNGTTSGATLTGVLETYSCATTSGYRLTTTRVGEIPLYASVAEGNGSGKGYFIIPSGTKYQFIASGVCTLTISGPQTFYNGFSLSSSKLLRIYQTGITGTISGPYASSCGKSPGAWTLDVEYPDMEPYYLAINPY